MDRIVREKERRLLTGISESTCRREERRGNFPPRRSIGKRCVGWLESEIQAWLRERSTRIGVSSEGGM